MKKSYFYFTSLVAGGFLLTTSCVDDKYDLSDIDTTTAIKIDNLTVPVKLNTIKLTNVLDADEDGLIGIYPADEKEENQYYAIKQEGNFEADPVRIKELQMLDYFTVPTLTVPASSGKIENTTTPFSYLIKDVDEALKSLTYFGLNEDKLMEITLTVTPSSAVLSNVKLQIPETYVAVYNNVEYTGGVIPVNIINGSLEYPVIVKTMSFEPSISPNSDHNLDIRGNIGINYADVTAEGNVSLSFVMSPYNVNVVSGTIEYPVELPYIEPVDLNDLPDFLTEGETTLILQNPQLYLNFSSLFGAYYNTNLTIIPEGVDTEIIDINDLVFQQSIVMAPDPSDLGLDVSLESTVLKEAPQLMNILKGKGLPERISIEMDQENTLLEGEVDNLVLGLDEGIAVSGGYKFFTPLAFAEGSQILYQKSETDFFGDDVEDVKVSNFRIVSDVTSELPVEVELTLYPLNKNGERIPGKNGYVSGSTIVTKGDSKLDLHIDEEFTGLDGIEYVVKADNMNGVSLSPSQTITLNNIRATLSGEYITKL